jgi:dihydroxyacetone kinase-like predicted kinase
MSFMDKLKEQAEQVAAKAQQGTAQVQTKIDAVQAKRTADSLLHDLGAAYYAEQRQSGPHAAVESALAALDAHASQTAPIDASTTGPQPTPTQAAPPAAAPQPPGDFKLDDV